MNVIEARSGRVRSLRYNLFGATLELTSTSNALLEDFDASFTHFRRTENGTPDFTLRLVERRGCFEVEGLEDSGQRLERDAALPALIECVSTIVMDRLRQNGILVVHAAAVTHNGRALLLAGPSGRGKTTLALGLVAAGMSLLSDELALIEPTGQTVHQYRRSVHVRPGTPELVPEFGFLLARPQRNCGGGIRWVLSPEALEQAIPGALSDPTPLHEVLLLEPRSPLRAQITELGQGSTAVELLQGTPSITEGLPTPLGQLRRALAGARCARLRPGSLPETVSLIEEWSGSNRRSD